MADVEEVKLFGITGSPFTCRVQIALKLKGIQYEFIEEDVSNKSAELLKYNPVHKKAPVFLHNGKPIPESALIVEYIDEVWKGPSILPEDPYEKAMARFWAKFIDDKLATVVGNSFFGKGEEQEKAIEEAPELLKTLEKQLIGKKYFGGERIGLVDIVADFIGYWVGILQQVTGIELVTKERFPRLSEWMDDFVSCDTVKECLPNRDFIFQSLRSRLGKA